MENTKHTESLNLLDLTCPEMEGLVGELGWPAFRTTQILQWLYQHRIREIGQMTNLSKADRVQLESRATIRRTSAPTVHVAKDNTQKFLFPFEDGKVVESVLIPEGHRRTLCVSTQIGCTLDCSFCLTGRMGLKRNLKAHEIVEQVLVAQDFLQPSERLSSLVFMGMGEPLANSTEVADAITRMTSDVWGLGFPARRITISTAGMALRLPEVATWGVNLAVSLNATTNALREKLMPSINRLYPLPDLMAACRSYPLPQGRRLTFEYVLLAGVNDTREDARRLIKLLTGIRCKINLIPFNEFAGNPFRRPSDETIFQFQSILREAHYDVFIRKSRGQDILGACGQLGELPT